MYKAQLSGPSSASQLQFSTQQILFHSSPQQGLKTNYDASFLAIDQGAS
jgi:hypothetical protein